MVKNILLVFALFTNIAFASLQSNNTWSLILDKDNIQHLNFTKEIKGKEKYFYDNAYIDFDPHLKESFHYSLFAKKIIQNLNKYLSKN